ncbi:2-oxo-4-hydroxy-4-carboxy-5-ureidoimidazoline decarboxylase-like [Leptopilina boulardi]|uniref:2-oxo-4-hydroxy-4-carboxy-5-ureidoimidazoline decarboxylase-like n=1 Tax=Leptopilina boulardi TaxID=63433 RepID=UPI0021F6119F|nr:2-oxo-4-hydroxy-4-carboxy-5-ureidoimidazoline decarboxylase-like [Leptopilina boulardi]
MSAGGILSITEVNALPNEQFEWIFGNVIEHSPEAAKHVFSEKPFSTCETLKSAFDNYLDKLNIHDKEIILLKHPELAGKLLDEGKLTGESKNEQKSAGLDNLTKEEKLSLSQLNFMYKEKFQFPFVICVKKNKMPTILMAIESRLKNSREVEINLGIDEVKKICRIRINDIVWPDT